MAVFDIAFYILAVITLGSGAVVALSRNIVHSAFSLLGTFLGVAGLYVLLSADFMAAAQLLVYVGGVMVLILFAVMLTNRIGEVELTNTSKGILPGLLLCGAMAVILAYTVATTSWETVAEPAYRSTAALLGEAFLRQYLLPFEVLSVLLLAVLIGAVVVATKELKSEEEPG